MDFWLIGRTQLMTERGRKEGATERAEVENNRTKDKQERSNKQSKKIRANSNQVQTVQSCIGSQQQKTLGSLMQGERLSEQQTRASERGMGF